MFSANARSHIEKEMKIILASIENKILENVKIDYQDDLVQLIEELVDLSKDGKNAREKINNTASILSEKVEDTSVKEVIDTLEMPLNYSHVVDCIYFIRDKKTNLGIRIYNLRKFLNQTISMYSMIRLFSIEDVIYRS